MTAEQDRGNGLPPPRDPRPLLEGFEMPPDSVLLADAQREIFEGKILHGLCMTESMSDDIYTSAMESAVLQGKVARSRMVLLTGTYDLQGIVDSLDLSAFPQELGSVDSEGKEIPMEPYQVEMGFRSDANLIQEVASPDPRADRKILAKRYAEARKLATEKGVAVEEVFLFHDLYFELMRRSTSPEDIISQIQQLQGSYRAVAIPLAVNDARTDFLAANIENEGVEIDALNAAVEAIKHSNVVNEDFEEYIREIEDYLHAYALAAIERYWGLETAALFR